MIWDLATVCLNKIGLASNQNHRFELPSKPTPRKARAFELLGVGLAMQSVRDHDQPDFINSVQRLTDFTNKSPV